MGTIRKKIDGHWNILASGKATGISVASPNLINTEDTSKNNVESVLSKHQEDIETLKQNVAWLAKHGGGGYGGGGGSSAPDITEATCNITVNNCESGSNVLVDENGIQVMLNDIAMSLKKSWSVTVRIGSTQIATTSISTIKNFFYIDFNKIQPYLKNHTGNLSISAIYEDDVNGIYGSSNWTGTVTEATVNISTENYSYAYTNLHNANIIYTYSVGILGEYTLVIEMFKNGSLIKTHEESLTINTSSPQTKEFYLSNLMQGFDESALIGVYNITTTLYYKENALIMNTYKSTLTLVSEDILIATTALSDREDSPTEVSLSSAINLSFIAYLLGASSYTYSVRINDTLVFNGNGQFSKNINEVIPLNKDWAILDEVTPLHLTVSSGEKSKTVTYYLLFTEAADTFLELSDDSKTHLITQFLSREYSSGKNSFNLVSETYQQSGNTFRVASNLSILNGNSLSNLTINPNTGQPYLRISNGAYGMIGSWYYNNRSFNMKTLFDYTNAFTISLAFKADYHPDDDRTILYCGNVDINTGELTSGISIDVHDVYITNRSVIKLTDSTINFVDITCQKVQAQDIVNGVEQLYDRYIIKVYVDGVLSAVSMEDRFPSLSNNIYLGTRMVDTTAEYLCDCNIYNLQIYDTALSDFDIVINYINNRVSTDYKNSIPNFDIIAEELKYNFCAREADGSVTSHMFKNGQYNIDFLLTGDKLSSEKLNSFASDLGIPVMLIDVSGDSAWTFNNFIVQQTAGSVSLSPTSGRTIQYWDPNGSNTNVITLNDATIELQGTSTLADAVKNLNITLPNSTMFIPKESWFPEQTYTLKADVVDSSHSNNASIGLFINEKLSETNYFPFSPTALENVNESEYKKTQHPKATLKHTVEGFPVFLIMKFNVPNIGDISITPLGIYSFNIGRDAYRNLGFKKVTSITNIQDEKIQITTFPAAQENITINEVDTDANWIEISDTTSLADMIEVEDSLPDNFNSAKGDFWQNHDSILNARYKVRYPSGRQPSDYSNFKTFVGNIMALPIEGCSTTDVMGNVTSPKISGSYNLYKVDTASNYSLTGTTQEFATDANTFPSNLGFDRESAFKYFTIGLLFGLIDNFGKNSTYRSWGGNEYYVDFYDLDCALGGDNQGDISVGADLWIKYLYNNIPEDKRYGYICESFNKDKAHSKSVVSANHNKLWLSLDTDFSRALFGSAFGNSAYSYYWRSLRVELERIATAHGYTDFADYFIDNYFIQQTKKCGPLLFNYDYKLKYLLQFNSDEYTNTKSLSKLHGRKISIARDWLKKHINFLDSLFYWRDKEQTLNFKNDVKNAASNTVLDTPESMPMMSNCPIIMEHSVGNSTQAFYFMQTNKKTYVNTANNSSNSPLNWNFTNSSNIIEIGDEDNPLSSMNVKTMSHSANLNKLNAEGYPAMTALLFANNKAFVKDFSLDSFATGDVSELRVIDLSNTAGDSFSLSLVRGSGDNTYTKFSKLTKIDISNSTCVTNMSIPEVPLEQLLLLNSSITEFNLINQKYITNVPLTGCTKLNSITIYNCASYEDFSISGLNNLKSVSIALCENIRSISISGCPNLTQINIENCPKLTSIHVTGCGKLIGTTQGTNHFVIMSCAKLEELSVENNEKLKKVVVSDIDRSRVTTLRLHNTLITDLSSSNINSGNASLDLSEFTRLNIFTCYGNSDVEYIQFANIKATPVPITSTFQGCTNLKRIYGNFLISSASYDGKPGVFRECPLFTIHGDENTAWKSKNKKQGNIWKTPWELLKASPNEYNNVTWDDSFQDGTRVTNFKFKNQNGVLNYLLYGTNATQFDVYYTLFIYALSGITINQSASWTFRRLKTPCFDWATGNQPNRYTFYKCSTLTSLGEFFESRLTYLYSPTVSNGVVTEDNGLFSPLVNITSFGTLFSGSVVFSKWLLRRKSGNYPITSLHYIGVKRIVDEDTTENLNYSNLNNQNYLLSNYSTMGNYTDFFKNMPSITSIGHFGNGDFINYDNLKIPNTVTSIINAFNSVYGQGSIDLRLMFSSGSKCTKIVNSFKISNVLPIENGKVKFPIANDTFKNLKSIAMVGHNPLDLNGGTNLITSFSGDGLDKYIEGDTFPYDITTGLTKLTIFSGFFKKARLSKALVEEPVIPSNMFKTNTLLENVASLFYDVDFAFTLSGEGFSECKNLNNVSYFCYHRVTSDDSERSKLHGMIPYKMFYHGIEGTSVKVVRGTNGSKPTDDFNISNLSSYSINVTIPRANIKDMTKCFYGCLNLEPYTNGTLIYEENSNYEPFDWIYNAINRSWYEGTDKYRYDASWAYDGNTNRQSGYKYLDSSSLSTINDVLGKSEILNYMCPPDLFRYCQNNAATTITGVFENCGLSYSISSGGNIASNENYYYKGITGRIPPHLLRPLSNITNISGMFKNCKKLASCNVDGQIYQIPKDFFTYAKNITDLTCTFQGLAFQPHTNLAVFTPLSKPLDIRGIFQASIWGVNDNSWEITNVFTSNNTSKISGAFSLKCMELNNTNASGMDFREYHSVGLPNRTTINNCFGTKIPNRSNIYYTYLGWSNKATDANIPDINNNYQ